MPLAGARKLIAKFPSLMRQREGFHTCRRHVFHAQRQLCFHTVACSGIYIHRHSRCNSLSDPSRRSFSGDGSDKLPLHEQRYFLFTKRTEICKHWDTQGLRNIFPRNGSLLCDVHWLYRCLCSGNWSPLRGSMNYTQSVYVNTPIRAYESAAGAAHEIPPGGGAKAALRAA